MTSVETKTLEYEKWIGSTPEDLGLSSDDENTFVHSSVSSTGQRLHVLTVDARPFNSDGERTGQIVLSASPYNSYVNERVVAETQTIAHQMGALVCRVETPGVAPDQVARRRKGIFQTKRQALSLLEGDFTEIARSQLGAIDSILHLQDGEHVTLIGRSMAAAAVSAMAKLLVNNEVKPVLSVDRIVYIDPVNIASTSLSRVMQVARQIGDENIVMGPSYRRENDEIGLAAYGSEGLVQAEPRLSQLALNWLLGSALRRGYGSQVLDTVKHGKLNDTEIIVTRPADSSVSRDSVNAGFVEAVRDAGGKARAIRFESGDALKKVGHDVLDSIGRAATFGQFLAAA